MKILHTCLLLFFFLPVSSQTLLFYTGYAHDMNNTHKSFNFIPVKVKWFPFERKTISFFAGYDFGLNNHGEGEAYTLNPDLSPQVGLKEIAKTNLLTVGMDINLNLYTTSGGNQLVFSFSPSALSFQHFKVSYPEFDKENYEILNQDINRNSNGLVFIFGLDYRFNHNKIFAVDVSTPLLRDRPDNFNYMYASPLRMMIGYQFSYRKTNNNE